MDSTHSKVSSGILFVIFWVIDQKIWISKDWIEIWFQNLIWIRFKSEADTCLIPIGLYRFVWISDVERRILKDLDVPDWTVPFQLSGTFWSVRWGSNGRGESKREESYLGFLGARRRRDLGQGVDLRWALVASGRRRCYDGVQEDEAGLGAWSLSSMACRGERELRLEGYGRRWSFGRWWGAHFHARFSRRKALAWAPEREEGDRREKGKQGSPAASNFTGDACRSTEIRRAISSCWGGIGERGKGRRGRSSWALYRRDQLEEQARVWLGTRQDRRLATKPCGEGSPPQGGGWHTGQGG
jgi:hypothetical protein